jgi:hypothetical protein
MNLSPLDRRVQQVFENPGIVFVGVYAVTPDSAVDGRLKQLAVKEPDSAPKEWTDLASFVAASCNLIISAGIPTIRITIPGSPYVLVLRCEHQRVVAVGYATGSSAVKSLRRMMRSLSKTPCDT